MVQKLGYFTGRVKDTLMEHNYVSFIEFRF